MLSDLFASIEATLLSRFREAGFVKHAGDKGENREHILREFLAAHLPKRYGVTKGEIITRSGQHSHSADIIVYDAENAPLLYSERTAIVPIEGIYGIIEVKSSLSKSEFIDAAQKVERLKRMAPRDFGAIQTRQCVTLRCPSRPFGIIFGFDLADNSLDSLAKNWEELNKAAYYVDYFANFACVLGQGLLRYERANLTRGEKTLLIDTNEFVNLLQTQIKRADNNEPHDEITTRIVVEHLMEKTFGRFFVYLLILLSRMKINVPDLGQYIDPGLPPIVVRES